MNQLVSQWTSALGLHAVCRAMTRRRVRIVTYHGVDERQEPIVNFDGLQVPPALFEKHLEIIGRRYRVISLQAAVRALREDADLPSCAVVITFDDGYRNNLEVAEPLLRRFGFPATFFVTTGFVDGRARPWWYEARALIARSRAPRIPSASGSMFSIAAEAERRAAAMAWERALLPMPVEERGAALHRLAEACGGAADMPYGFLQSDQLQTLLARGHDVQGHGDRHLSWRVETEDALASDLTRAQGLLAEWLGRKPDLFAFPYGHVPRDPGIARRIFAEQRIAGSCTTQFGLAGRTSDVHFLPRLDVHGGRTPQNLDSLLSGLTVAVSAIRHGG